MAVAPGTITTANFAAAMKQIYPQKRVELIFYKNHPFMAKVRKRDDFYGFDSGGTMAILRRKSTGSFDKQQSHLDQRQSQRQLKHSMSTISSAL